MFGIPAGPVRRKILIHGMDRFHFLFQQNRAGVTNREREEANVDQRYPPNGRRGRPDVGQLSEMTGRRTRGK